MRTWSAPNVMLTIATMAITLAPAMANAGILTGRVSNPNNTGVANVKVEFFESSTGNQIAVSGNLTDVNGNYGVLVPDGTYDVEFVTPVLPGGIVPIRYASVVISGTVTLNVSRPFGKVMNGTVFDTIGGTVTGVDLNVINALTGELEFTPNDNTGALGDYALIVSPGLKNIIFSDQNAGSRLAAQSLQNVSIVNDTTIDVSLPAGVFVSGTVLDAFSQPVEAADLDFDESATELRLTTPNDNTDNNGDYIVTVPVGVYNITVEPLVADRLVAQRIFSIPVNHDTTINFTLLSGWSLSGTVTGPGGAVNGCDIDVVDTVTLAKLVTPGDKTNAAGFYEVIVPAGNFEVRYQPPAATHLSSLVKNPVHVGQDTVVNASLQTGVLLQGTVQSASGGLVDACDIDILVSSTQATVLAAGDKTNFNGFYQMVVPSNTYDLEYEAPKSRRLQAKRLTGQAINSDQTRNVTLDSGLSVSGVIMAGGPPLANVNVDAMIESSGLNTFQPGDLSNASGSYQIIIGFVPHTLIFYPPVISGYAAKKLTGVNPGADLIQNVALNTGFLVSGTATQVGGAPVSGATLRAEVSGVWVPSSEGIANASGQYQTRLGPASYRLVYKRPIGDSVVLNPVNITKDTVINVQFPVPACTCPNLNDPDPNGVPDIVDVGLVINRAFRGIQPILDPACPQERTDVDGTGVTDIVDVGLYLNVAFRGANKIASFDDDGCIAGNQ